MTKCGLHPDFAIAQFDRKDRYVIGPKIKGAAAFEVEAGVVPMTGQDAVVDAAALEREAHVRAAIVDGKDTAVVVENKDRTMITVHERDDPSPLAPRGCPQARIPWSARPSAYILRLPP